jgi:hypothetical protein
MPYTHFCVSILFRIYSAPPIFKTPSGAVASGGWGRGLQLSAGRLFPRFPATLGGWHSGGAAHRAHFERARWDFRAKGARLAHGAG